MPFSTSVCRTAAVRKVEGACRLSCSCGPGQWPGRDVDGQENGAEGPTAFGSGEKRNHPWADWQARSSLEPSAHQAITPGPCRGWGRHRLAHIRAQREPVLHRRAPAPITADHEGSPGGSCSLASHRETLRRGRKKRRSTERAWCGSQRSYLQVPRPGTAGRDAHTDQEGVARWASRRACGGVRDRGHAAEGGHGSRGTGRSGAFAAATARARGAALELPDSTGSVPLQSG